MVTTTTQDTRIRFGDGQAQDLPLNLTEALLRRLWAKSPAAFGALLRQAMMDVWAPSAAASKGHDNDHDNGQERREQ
jgi:hypothetical protein